jgi:hypothetical protein
MIYFFVLFIIVIIFLSLIILRLKSKETFVLDDPSNKPKIDFYQLNDFDYLNEVKKYEIILNEQEIQLSKEIITTPLEDQMELMIKNIQKAKKDANLKPYQIVDVFITITNTDLNQIITEEYDNIVERLRSNVHLNHKYISKDISKDIYISQYKNDYYQFIVILNQ